MLRLTVDNLIADVRSKIDLEAAEGIDDLQDILPALNRGQKYAVDILSRQYPEPFLKELEVAIVAGTSVYTIPEDAYSDRLLMVERKINNYYQELDRISYREKSRYESTNSTAIPEYYVLKGRKYELVPSPNSQTDAVRLWYVRQPEEYVKEQGRITAVTEGSNRVTLDTIGSDLTTDAESLNAYVNVIDGDTGEIKATLQIKTIDTDAKTVVFKSTASRSTVFGRTIQTDISSLSNSVTIEQDDFLCSVYGTCVPFFRDPIANFVIEYATAEMKDKLQRENVGMAQQVLDKFEAHVKSTWAGRETKFRVDKANRYWNNTYRQRRTYYQT